MPFNTERTVRLDEFLARVERRLEVQPEALAFFKHWLQPSLASVLETLRESGAPPLPLVDLLAGDFDVIYPVAARKLADAASVCFSEAYQTSYKDAHAVSAAFCAELNEFFECSGVEVYELLHIKSPLEIMSQ